MIKATELRVGNIFDDPEGFTHTVKGIDDNCIVIKYYNADDGEFSKIWPTRHVSFENAKPIRLTPEILEKCGFEKDGSKWKYRITLYEFNINGIANYYINYENHKIPVLYLHQLQNLFAELCSASGEELNVQL